MSADDVVQRGLDPRRPQVEPCEAWKDRFQVILRCRDCRADFVILHDSLHLTVEQTAHRTRMLLTAVPEACPSCSNLKAVDGVFDDEEPRA